VRAVRLHGPRDIQFHDEPIPVPGAGEVRVQIKSVGICASDLHYYRDGRIGSTVVESPLILGHEASGVIDALGDGVTGLYVGDRVAIEPGKSCMNCKWCMAGWFNLCPDVQFFGTPPTDGCLRDFVTWPARLAVKVPDDLTFDEIAMLEPLGVAVYAADLGELKAGQTVAVLGAGAIGLLVLQAVRAAGIERVIVSEPVKARRQVALRLGATEAIDPRFEDLEATVARLTGGDGCDVVFECAGEDDAVRQSCKIASVMGRVVVVGIPDGGDYPFDASTARRKQLSAIFCRRSNDALDRSIEWVAAGKVDVASLATHRFALEHTQEAMELAISKSNGVVRAIVVVND